MCVQFSVCITFSAVLLLPDVSQLQVPAPVKAAIDSPAPTAAPAAVAGVTAHCCLLA
jgi:hypothetical protein